MSVIRELSAFVVGASAAKLPADENAMLRRHVADTLVAAVAGAQTTEGRALRKVVLRTSAADAAGLLAAVVRHTEIDDIHTRSCTTPSSVTVPTALVLAGEYDSYDADTVASAIWIGTELMTRLGVAIDGARILYRGLWPTYFTAPLGAAAIAARMLHLSEEQTAHALSLALMLSAGRSGRFHGALPGRSVILAMAVANGVRAAQAAKDGVGGDPALLDGPWLKDAHGIDAKIEALTAGLGSGSIYPQMTIKPFCSAKQAIAAVEAFTSIIDDGVSPDAITQGRRARAAALFPHGRDESGSRRTRLDHRQRRVPDRARGLSPRAALRHRARRCDERRHQRSPWPARSRSSPTNRCWNSSPRPSRPKSR